MDRKERHARKMDELDFDEEEQMAAAVEKLQSKAKGAVLHQGIALAPDTGGITTRAGVRRTSKDRPGPSRATKRKPPSKSDPPPAHMEEDDHLPEESSAADGGWLHTILTDMHKKITDLVSMVSTLNAQLFQERQRTSNLELRVENLQ